MVSAIIAVRQWQTLRLLESILFRQVATARGEHHDRAEAERCEAHPATLPPPEGQRMGQGLGARTKSNVASFSPFGPSESVMMSSGLMNGSMSLYGSPSK